MAAGDGVLFVDVDGDRAISTLAEYGFTEWDRTASADMEALARVFDTSGDGKLSAADAQWDKFHVMRTNADGSTEVKTLAQLGITEINLRPHVTRIRFASVIILLLPVCNNKNRKMLS